MEFQINDLMAEINFYYKECVNKSFPYSSLPVNLTLYKTNEEAFIKRNLGNKKYLDKKHEEALYWFCQSVASAPENSEELARAYSNRSAALFRIGHYIPSLLDLNRAMQLASQEYILENQLHERKLQCLVMLRIPRQSKNALSWSEMLPDIQIYNAAAGYEYSEYYDLYTGDETDPIDESTEPSWKATFTNSLIPNASPKIRLKFVSKWGRYMVANKDIEPGEILLSEEFYSTMISFDRRFNHCSFCFVKCYCLIPCQTCTLAMYCSERCRDKAFNMYHRTECKIWPVFISEGFTEGTDFLSVRTFLIGTEQGSQLENMMQTVGYDIQKVFEQDIDFTKPFVNDYWSIFRLQKKFPKPDSKMIMLVLKIINQLKNMSFFPMLEDTNQSKDVLGKVEMFATILLLNHMVTFRLYCYLFTDVRSLHMCYDGGILGSGVCPIYNMLNHSCDPNVAGFVNGREHVVYALQPIKQNEQIFTSYCTPFWKHAREHRFQMLQIFEFVCHCEACTGRWPLLKDLMKRKPKFLTENKKIIKEIKALKETISKNSFFNRELHKLEAFENIVKFSKLLHGNVKKPSSLMILSKSLIISIMKLKSTDTYITYPPKEEDEPEGNLLGLDELVESIRTMKL